MAAPIKLNLRNGFQQYLQGLGTPFTLELTTQSTKIKTNLFTYIGANKHLKPSQLGFVLQVKRYAEKTGIPDTRITGSQILYFRFSDKIKPGTFEGYTELDVNQAYWQIALQKGYLSTEIYEKGLQVDKIVRLVALGALASKKSCHEFDGKQYKFIEEKANETTRSYFFDIAHELDNLMSSTLSRYSEDVLFYWVDAFFVKATALEQIKEVFRVHGLGLKEKKIDRIEVEAREGYDLVHCYMEGSDRPKTFICIREENRGKYVMNKHQETLEEARRRGLI